MYCRESAGLNVQGFSSAEEFLRSRRPDLPACLLLDVRLPRLSGLDLQRELAKAGVQIPIIFITGHGDIPMTVQAMKAGAIEFLTKPFREQDLLDTIRRAINFDRAARLELAKLEDLRGRYHSLTPREREVMANVVTGMLAPEMPMRLSGPIIVLSQSCVPRFRLGMDASGPVLFTSVDLRRRCHGARSYRRVRLLTTA
jgi:FixJ family two-component response regulator